MQKITSVSELRKSIVLLEIKQANEFQLLKEQLNVTLKSLNPIDQVKKVITDMVTAPDFKGNLIDSILGLASGYLSKKVIVGDTKNPIKKLLGTFLQMGVTNLVSKNADGIKNTGFHLIKNIFRKKDIET